MTATSDSNGIVTFEKLHNTLYYYRRNHGANGIQPGYGKHYFIIKNIKDDAKRKEYEN